jgi:hypothetical protein
MPLVPLVDNGIVGHLYEGVRLWNWCVSVFRLRRLLDSCAASPNASLAGETSI